MPNGSTKENVNLLLDLIRASNVKRYHTFPIIGEQTVGHHSHRVALLLIYLTNGKLSCNLIKAALFHDLAEIHTGDIPATTKWAHPNIADLLKRIENTYELEHEISVILTEKEKKLLKTADMCELMLFAEEQHMLGNKNARELWCRGYNYLVQLGTYDSIKEIINERDMAKHS